MSSKPKKHKEKGFDRSGSSQQFIWSQWVWDGEHGIFYRYRDNPENANEPIYDDYFYPTSAQPVPPGYNETPRGETGSSTLPEGFDASDTSYHSNSGYGYEDQSCQTPGDSLADDLASTSLSGSQRPQPSYSTSYQGEQLDIYDAPSESTAAIPIPTGSRSNPNYAYSASAPAAGGGWDKYEKYSGAPSMSNFEIPEGSTAQWSYQQQDRDVVIYGQSSSSRSQLPDQQTDAEERGSGALTPNSRVHKLISGTGGKVEKLDPSFTVKHSSEFSPGRVFKIVWSEPQGSTYDDRNKTKVTEEVVTRWGQKVYTTIRRFVIVKSGQGHSQCVPVLTYGHQGATKKGINGRYHAIIFSGDKAPSSRHGETELKKPIKVKMNTPRDKLDDFSRVHYAKIYTVEHNVKVHFIGRIADTHWRRFITDFDATWDEQG